MALTRYRDGDELFGQQISVSGRQAYVPAVTIVDATGVATATQVQGDVAATVADSGNPVKVGTKTQASYGALSGGTRANLASTLFGEVLVAPFAMVTAADAWANDRIGVAHNVDTNNIMPSFAPFGFNGTTWDRQRGDTNGMVVQPALSSTFWNYAAATGGIVNTTTAVTIKTAAGASVRNYLKSLSVSHDALGAVTEIAVRDGAGGTVLWRGKLQTTAVDSCGGAGTINFDPPLKGTANTLLEVVTLTAVTGGVFVNAQGYTGA